MKAQFECGIDKFWSIADLELVEELKSIYDVRALLIKLYAFGYLDIVCSDVRRYRVKVKYLSSDVVIKSPFSPNLTYVEFCKLFKEE